MNFITSSKPRVLRTHYSMQYACLPCRKAFKQVCAYGVPGGGRSRICPQCGGTMCRMGVAFKAPRRHDARAWRRVEYIINRGLIFYANVGRYPTGMHALRANVALRLRSGESLGQRLARRLKARRT